MYLSSSQRLHYKVVQIFLLLLIAIGASFSQYSTNAGKQYPPQNQQPPSSGHGSIPSTGNPLPPSQGPIPSGNGIPGGNIFPGSGIPSGNIFPGNGIFCICDYRWSVQSAAESDGISVKFTNSSKCRTCQHSWRLSTE